MRTIDDTTMCSRCGVENDRLLLSDTTFHCSACGLTVAVGSNTLQNMVHRSTRQFAAAAQERTVPLPRSVMAARRKLMKEDKL